MTARRWGQGAETALLLHCTLASGGAWAGVARHLGDRLSMVAPDLVGHGAAPDADRALDFCTQATDAVAAFVPETTCHLIGHSFGAVVALRLALDHPYAVKSLTLIEPVLFCASDGPGRIAHDAYVAELPGAYQNDDPKAVARHFINLWGEKPFDSLPQPMRDYMTHRIWIPAATEPAVVQDNANVLARLPQLSAPTLLLDGALSPPVIAEINSRLAADISGATRETVPDAAHMLPVTHPGATANVIRAFLDQH